MALKMLGRGRRKAPPRDPSNLLPVHQDETVVEARTVAERVGANLRRLEAELAAIPLQTEATDVEAILEAGGDLPAASPSRSRDMVQADIARLRPAVAEAERVLRRAEDEAARSIREALDAERTAMLEGMAGSVRGLVEAIDARERFLDRVNALGADGSAQGEAFPWTASGLGIGSLNFRETRAALEGWLREHRETGFRVS